MSGVRANSVDDAELARRATTGDGAAFGQLFERWFDRAFDVAWHVVRNRDTAAEATQEAFAAAWQQIATLRQPESFGGWLLRIARNQALNRLERERRSRPLGDEEALAVLDGERRSGADPAASVTSQERDDLVWAASAALGEADVSLLSLHLRHGLDAGELADELGVAPNAAHQRLFRLRKRLAEAIAAWTVWQRGSPRCDVLRQLLDAAGMTRFDRDASSVINVHVDSCPECRSRQALTLSPEALFAATPFVLAGPALKARAAAALSADGVPVSTDPGSPSSASGAGRSRLATRLVAAGMVALAAAAALAVLVSRQEDEPVAARPIEADDPAEASEGKKSADPTTSTTASPTSNAPQPTSPAGAPGPADPPIVVPDPDPTTTVTSTTTATRPPAPRPVIGGFRATPASAPPCTGGSVRVTFVWESTHATSALLGPSRGIAEAVDPSGDLTTCAQPGIWTLQVTGPGGTATDRVTV